MKTIVIHHSADFDGLFCREIAHKFLPDATLIGWDYGDPVPTPDVVSSEDNLYMLDISVEGLMGHPKLIWIDHHKSAIDKYSKDIPGYRIDGVAACRLAYQWFWVGAHLRDDNSERQLPTSTKPDFVERKVIEPLSVRLAGEYDIWDKRDPRADLFQYGLKAQELTPSLWDTLLSNRTENSITVDSLLERGTVLQYAQTKLNESIIKAAGFTIKFEGFTFLACNNARYNSHLFTAGLKPEHDACLGFAYRAGSWHVSLYHAIGKEHHDLSVIASKHGGGGHRGACGFRMNSLPFLT